MAAKNIVVVGGGSEPANRPGKLSQVETDACIYLTVSGITLVSLLEASVAKSPNYNVILVSKKDYFYHLIGGLRASGYTHYTS